MTNAAGFRYVDNRAATGAHIVPADMPPAAVELATPGTPAKRETVALDHIQAKIDLYDKAEKEFNQLGVELKLLKQEIIAAMGSAEVAKVRGVKVFTHQLKKSWRTADLLKDEQWGEVASRYLVPTTVQKIDMAAFAKDHPAVARAFQTQEFRRVTGGGAV